jgi:signal transduction histidine kinase
VDSTPGEGTVFVIELPLVEPAGDEAAADTLRAAS